MFPCLIFWCEQGQDAEALARLKERIENWLHSIDLPPGFRQQEDELSDDDEEDVSDNLVNSEDIRLYGSYLYQYRVLKNQSSDDRQWWKDPSVRYKAESPRPVRQNFLCSFTLHYSHRPSFVLMHVDVFTVFFVSFFLFCFLP